MNVRGYAPPTTVGSGGRSWVYVDDCAECLVLIANKGGDGEFYLICNQHRHYAEIYAIWDTTPGGMKAWFTMPSWMAVPGGYFFETVQRLFGLPNVLSAEAARLSELAYNFSGNKARTGLGWQPGDVREQWLATLAEERRRAGKG